MVRGQSCGARPIDRNEQYLLTLRRKLKELDDKYGSGIIRSA
jgi:hypothetical protein